MLASISRLRPRAGSFEQALLAFRAANFSRCLSDLHGVSSIAAQVLRARTLLRLGDPAGAATALDGARPDAPGELAEVALLRAVAQARLGADADADQSLSEAFAYSVSAFDLTTEAEVEYYRALTAFGRGQHVRARNACEAALALASSSERGAASARIVPLTHVAARAEELLGVLKAANGEYREAIPHARAALAMLDGSAVSDAFATAFAIRNLTIYARDFDIATDARLMAARVPRHAWTDDLAIVEFTTVEALGWCSALRGDSVDALRQFRRAAAAATSDSQAIIIGVDRALLAREFGHAAMVVEELENALELARRCDWESAVGDTRDALLGLAQVTASVSPGEAREMLERYDAIRKRMDVNYAARLEPRARAEEAYSHGLVLRAEGRLASSVERLENAFETWETIGYEWRAARAALELAELGAGDVFRLAVRQELFRRPDSVFSERARLVA